jgi:hypothetical protein
MNRGSLPFLIMNPLLYMKFPYNVLHFQRFPIEFNTAFFNADTVLTVS